MPSKVIKYRAIDRWGQRRTFSRTVWEEDTDLRGYTNEWALFAAIVMLLMIVSYGIAMVVGTTVNFLVGLAISIIA